MPVGTTALTFFQQESIAPRFTVSDPRVSDITGWTVTFVIKNTAADADPPLHGPVTATMIGPGTDRVLEVSTTLPTSLAPGTYVYSLRRTGVGTDWQLAQAALTVVDSAHKQTS
jgi:hypothetical protein